MIVEALPSSFALALTELSLLVVGIVVERYYVSRVSSFTNAVALMIHILATENVSLLLGLYADLAIVIGGIGIIAYALNKSLNWVYYDISFLLYSSINVGLVIALSSVSFLLALVLGVLIQLAIAIIGDLDELLHMGDYSGATKRFHQNNNLVTNGVKFDLSGYFK